MRFDLDVKYSGRVLVCRWCGNLFWWKVRRSRPPTYCGSDCYRHANNEHARIRSRCSAPAKRAATAERLRREQEEKLRQRQELVSARQAMRPCECCGQEFKPTQPWKQKYCGEHCKNVHKARLRRITKAGDRTPIVIRSCIECSRVFVADARGHSFFCSADCKRAAYRRSKTRLGKPEVSVQELGDRDSWRCHICGRAVKSRVYRGRKMDPTIDHLIPYSAGGSHDAVNLALAHLHCNVIRNNRGEAQLRMIA
jgi:hypothetical protein